MVSTCIAFLLSLVFTDGFLSEVEKYDFNACSRMVLLSGNQNFRQPKLKFKS